MVAGKRLTTIAVVTARAILLVALVPCGLVLIPAVAAQEPTQRSVPRPHAAPATRYQATQATYLSESRPQPTQTGDGSVLKVYACGPGEAATIAGQWEQKYAGRSDVRIVVDPRTSQIVVRAPPDIQAEISEQFAARQPAAAESTPPDSSPAGALRSEVVQLQRKTAGQFEAALVNALGARLSRVGADGSRAVVYRLTAAGGVAELGIDSQLGTVTVRGSGPAVQSCVRLIRLLDGAERPADDGTRLVSLAGARPTDVRRLVEAIRTGSEPGGRPERVRSTESSAAIPRNPLVAMLFQKPGQQPDKPAAETKPADTERPPPPPGKQAAAADQPDGDAGLIGPVQIELLDGLDVLVVRGHRRDVDRVVEIINQVERLSAVTQPAIEVYHLLHVDCEALAALVEELYAEVFFARQGDVSITALVKPNALLLIGRRECVNTVVELVQRLDRPVAPESQFRVFQLKHAPVETVKTMVDEFFAERGGLGTRVQVTVDFRSNSLILHASPRDIAEAAELIKKVDISTSQAVNELRVLHLENSLAEELAPILQEAINSQGNRRQGAARTTTSSQQRSGGAAGQQAEAKSAMLRFITIDKEGRRNWNSGILTDVRITADPRANAILVSAPANSMALIEALVRQLDKLPGAEAQIKVFTIVNGDAVSLSEVLETLFAQQSRGTNQPAVRTGAGEGDSSLVSLRFAVDMRTNSIIASGSKGDLGVVEAVLLRLDESGSRQRKSSVYRLKNAPAADVANAINEFLRSERQVQEVTTEMMSPFEQIEREVVVVPEPVSNSLIVSATPRFYEEIKELIEKLDEQPPMVMIQVLIIEVGLGSADEFGVELGLQDSLLFDRSVLGDIITTTQTTYDAFGNPTSQNETIVSASNAPGFNFNNQPLGNSGSTQAMQSAQKLAGQALSSFAVGRVNSELGYGGLVLSGTSRSVNVLIRALQENRRAEILSRPQIMTLDNQPAFIQVGERVPRISGSQVNQAGQINNIVLENVGLILGVTPRISPDNLVVMEIDAEKSAVGPIAEGIPVSISTYSGEVIKSPRIETTTAQTTVSALTGQTVVLGGLITKEKVDIHRRVPLLADVWLLGNLFRYDYQTTKRKELIIIMTPHIVRNEQDAEAIKQVEMARINWCLSDSLDMHGDNAIRGHGTEWIDDDTPVIYPDGKPIEAPPAELETDVPEAEPVPPPQGTPPKPGEEIPPEPPQQNPAAGSQIRLRPVDQVGYNEAVPPSAPRKGTGPCFRPAVDGQIHQSAEKWTSPQPGRVEQAVYNEYPRERYPREQYQPAEYTQPGPPVGIGR